MPPNDLVTELQTGEREIINTETVSNCCGAGHYEDNMICEDCGEHCGAEPEELEN
jgi:hypothetical protein